MCGALLFGLRLFVFFFFVARVEKTRFWRVAKRNESATKRQCPATRKQCAWCAPRTARKSSLHTCVLLLLLLLVRFRFGSFLKACFFIADRARRRRFIQRQIVRRAQVCSTSASAQEKEIEGRQLRSRSSIDAMHASEELQTRAVSNTSACAPNTYTQSQKKNNEKTKNEKKKNFRTVRIGMIVKGFEQRDRLVGKQTGNDFVRRVIESAAVVVDVCLLGQTKTGTTDTNKLRARPFLFVAQRQHRTAAAKTLIATAKHNSSKA
jgi:hypothetical protein